MSDCPVDAGESSALFEYQLSVHPLLGSAPTFGAGGESGVAGVAGGTSACGVASSAGTAAVGAGLGGAVRRVAAAGGLGGAVRRVAAAGGLGGAVRRVAAAGGAGRAGAGSLAAGRTVGVSAEDVAAAINVASPSATPHPRRIAVDAQRGAASGSNAVARSIGDPRCHKRGRDARLSSSSTKTAPHGARRVTPAGGHPTRRSAARSRAPTSRRPRPRTRRAA
jgi:hypothetical protein